MLPIWPTLRSLELEISGGDFLNPDPPQLFSPPPSPGPASQPATGLPEEPASGGGCVSGVQAQCRLRDQQAFLGGGSKISDPCLPL